MLRPLLRIKPKILRNLMMHRLYVPLRERLGSDKPEPRAGVAVSQIIGVGMGRYVLNWRAGVGEIV